MLSRRRIIYILVFIVATLLIINVLLNYTKKKQSVIVKESINRIEVETIFNRTISNYGIDSSWIKKLRLKKGDYDSINYKYSINLPLDVSIPQLLKDLNLSFYKLPVEINSEEKHKKNISTISIISNNYTKLISEFRYSSDLVRKYSSIGFLITDLENASLEDIEHLFRIGIPFAAILPLEEKSLLLAEFIKQNNQTYYVEIKSDCDVVEFELGEDLGITTLAKNVKNIISNFNSPQSFFINDLNSNINVNNRDYLKDEFRKRGRNLVSLNSHTALNGESSEDLKSLLKFHLNKLERGSSKLFIINYHDWLSLQGEFSDFTKQGNKIVPAGNLL